MNWGLIGTVAGMALTFYGIVFVLSLIRSLFGKEGRRKIREGIAGSCSEAGERFSDFISDKVESRRRRKDEQKNQKPVIDIR